MKEKRKSKSGRNPKLDPAVYRYTVRFNEEEHNRFLAMFGKSGVYARSVFLKAHFFGQPFKVLKVDKTLVDYYTKLSDFHAQFRAVGTNYNQVVKELRLHFSEKKAMALLYKLEQHTVELVKLSRQIVELVERNGSKMVAKISVGNSLYGAIAYNGEKINEAQGRLLTTNRIYNDGSGTVDISKAMEGFHTFLPPQMKVEKPVVHISLNPHPEDVLTDIELQNIAREYLEKLGFGNQPYLVFKHEDIDRHHLHIVTVNVDENGKRLNRDFLYRRSDRIRRELEQKYGLHPAERKNQGLDNPLRKVDASAGDVKKQVGNTVKALNGQYRFQTMGEYRALLSLYNMTVEEARGNVRGREYHGLVYSVTDDRGNKVGNPFKSSLFGKSAGYEAVQKKFVRSKSEIKDRKLADMTKRTVLSVLQGTYDKDRFISRLKEKGIDTVLRYTEEGRIYGATFIDHRTGCVLNGSRMGKELSANALQEHFTLPYAGQPPIPLSIPADVADKVYGQTAYDREDMSGGMGLLTPEGPATDAEEEAFIRAMKRKKKKKRKGLGM